MNTMNLGILISLLIIANSIDLLAQKKENQLGIVAEAGFPTDIYKTGLGGFAKGAYALNTAAQLTLQVGVARFRDNIEYTYLNGNIINKKNSLRTIPVLIGYKHYLHQFYIEPQVGFGELAGRYDIGGDWSRPSNGAFYWSAGVGYQFGGIDVGVRYQSAHATGGKKGGVWGDKRFTFIGIHLGNFLPLRK